VPVERPLVRRAFVVDDTAASAPPKAEPKAGAGE
jgi:hypothetical protein